MKILTFVLVSILSYVLSLYDVSKVKINSYSNFKGNELITVKPIVKDEIIVSIPLDTCIYSHRCGAIRGLVGQTDFGFSNFGDLRYCVEEKDEINGRTWDVNLALGLLMATNDESLAASGTFWDSYRSYFPPMNTLTLPFCYPYTELLQEFQDNEIQANALKQQQRLYNLFPNLDDNFHEALKWSFAMVRSRCFQLSNNWFAMVPIIDISNHDLNPTATFEFKTMSSSSDILNKADNSDSSNEVSNSNNKNNNNNKDENELPMNSYCVLKATRDMAVGEAVTIRYDCSPEQSQSAAAGSYSNERLLVQYGFILPDNPTVSSSLFNDLDLLGDEPLPSSNQLLSASTNTVQLQSSSQSQQQALSSSMSLSQQSSPQQQQQQVSDELSEALIDSVIQIQQECNQSEIITNKLQCLVPLLGCVLRRHPIHTVLTALQTRMKAFPTSLTDDYKLQSQLLTSSDNDSDNNSDRDGNRRDSSSSGGNGGGNDSRSSDDNTPHLRACLAFRIDKKENIKLCVKVLENALAIIKTTPISGVAV